MQHVTLCLYVESLHFSRNRQYPHPHIIFTKGQELYKKATLTPLLLENDIFGAHPQKI